jgi:hypothetical protein
MATSFGGQELSRGHHECSQKHLRAHESSWVFSTTPRIFQRLYIVPWPWVPKVDNFQKDLMSALEGTQELIQTLGCFWEHQGSSKDFLFNFNILCHGRRFWRLITLKRTSWVLLKAFKSSWKLPSVPESTKDLSRI